MNTRIADLRALAATPALDYEQVKARLGEAVRRLVPAGGTVAVMSRGDPELLELGHRKGWHFPREADGEYAGFHPEDGDVAIGQLRELVEAGAEYLVVPATAFWWFDHYGSFARYLEDRCRLIHGDRACAIFNLGDQPSQHVAARPATPSVDAVGCQVRALCKSLLPPDAVVLVASGGDEALVALEQEAWHFPRGFDGEWVEYRLDNRRELAHHLEELRRRGARYFVVPAESSWWLRVTGLRDVLAGTGRSLARHDRICEIFELTYHQGASRP